MGGWDAGSPSGGTWFDQGDWTLRRPLTVDADGNVVYQMKTWIWVRNGDQRGCIGCHERRTQAPPAGLGPLAPSRVPRRIEPIAGVPVDEGLSLTWASGLYSYQLFCRTGMPDVLCWLTAL